MGMLKEKEIKNDWAEKNADNGILRLFIPLQYFMGLNNLQKELFIQSDEGKFYIEFPIEHMNEVEDLGTYVTACLETALIIPNPRYEIDQASVLDCELLKLGKEARAFNLLITITYPGETKEYHDIMMFQEIKRDENLFEFELLGDQTLFGIN